MIKTGILGTGHLGKIHIQCMQGVEELELIGFYDPDEEVAKQVSAEYGLPSFPSAEALITAVDVCSYRKQVAGQ